MDVNVLYDRVVGYETNECEHECERDVVIDCWFFLSPLLRDCTHFLMWCEI